MDAKPRSSRIPVLIQKKGKEIRTSNSSGKRSLAGSSEKQRRPIEEENITGEPTVKSKLKKLEIRLNALKYDHLQREIALDKLSEDVEKRIVALEERIDTFTNPKIWSSQGGIPESA